MDKIEIRNLEIFANHGVFPEENVLGQKFVVSATLYTDTRKAGRTHVVKLDLLQGTLTGSSLFGLGSVGTESGNEFLEFFDLFFLFLVGFFHLFDEELAGFEPEVVVSGI